MRLPVMFAGLFFISVRVLDRLTADSNASPDYWAYELDIILVLSFVLENGYFSEARLFDLHGYAVQLASVCPNYICRPTSPSRVEL